jgi:ADP-heptose:LPS heptosyltransferase
MPLHLPEKARPKKILMIRLSSLGDVILATSALSAIQATGVEVHWLVSKDYASLLRGHPAITKLWEFDRRSGLKGWLSLCGELSREGFVAVYDLHSTLRSWIAHFFFFIKGSLGSDVKWLVINKQRLRLYGYFILKAWWPESLKPDLFVTRFARLVGGTGSERPDLRYLLSTSFEKLKMSQPEKFSEFVSFAQGSEKPYLCVMPSSKWEGKKWAVRSFFEVIKGYGLPVVVLGSRQDRESVLLVKMLEQAGLPYFSGVGVFDFPVLAGVLADSVGYLGNDTGLGHLAEAVGCRVVVLFGPTSPSMGFAPWRPDSQSVSASLWCQPCGKDGRFCFRLTNRYACQKNIKPREVLSALNKFEDREAPHV